MSTHISVETFLYNPNRMEDSEERRNLLQLFEPPPKPGKKAFKIAEDSQARDGPPAPGRLVRTMNIPAGPRSINPINNEYLSDTVGNEWGIDKEYLYMTWLALEFREALRSDGLGPGSPAYEFREMNTTSNEFWGRNSAKLWTAGMLLTAEQAKRKFLQIQLKWHFWHQYLEDANVKYDPEACRFVTSDDHLEGLRRECPGLSTAYWKNVVAPDVINHIMHFIRRSGPFTPENTDVTPSNPGNIYSFGPRPARTQP